MTFAELTAGLVWPTLLRSVVLALQPARLMLAFGLIVVLGASAHAYDWLMSVFSLDPVAAPVLTQMSTALSRFTFDVLLIQPLDALASLFAGVFAQPLAALSDHPISLGVYFILIIPVWAMAGGALSRMVALDVAGALDPSLGQGLAFAGRRGPSLAGSLLVPMAALGLIALTISLLGAALFVIPGVRVVGAALYGPLLALGFILTLLAVGFVLGQALLVPAVAVEGTDTMDAVQRSYAYVFGRPLRTALYLAFVLVQGAIAFALVRWVVVGAIDLTENLATAWLSGGVEQSLVTTTGPDVTTPATLIEGWRDIALLVLPAFVVSFYFSASTLVYLLLRRVNDEQDVSDIWMPGLIEGTLVPETQPSAPQSDPDDADQG